MQHPLRIGAQCWMHLGGQHGPQNPPKILPKSIKNRWKVDINMHPNFACISNGPLVALEANIAPKSLPRGGGRGRGFSSLCWACWGLGGLLGLLGPKNQILSIFDRFLVDFWSIFDRFLINFSTPEPQKSLKLYWFYKYFCKIGLSKLTSVFDPILVPTWLHSGTKNPPKST